MCHFLFLPRDWICIFASKTAGVSWWVLSVSFSLGDLFISGVVLLWLGIFLYCLYCLFPFICGVFVVCLGLAFGFVLFFGVFVGFFF